MSNDPMREIKDKLILALLPEIPFTGWTKAALAKTAQSLGMDPTMGERAFPGGPVDAVLHFIDLADRRLADEAPEPLGGLRLTARIRGLVRHRLESWSEHREAIRRASVILSLPGNALQAAKATWATADLMWRLAGDQPVDFSYYTKRASLSAVYSATLLYWMSDDSEGCADSWAFLDRRLEDLARLPKAMDGARRKFQHAEGLISSMLKNKPGGRSFGVRRT
jgi:ubiquinone biosynthesis protein COQ9